MTANPIDLTTVQRVLDWLAARSQNQQATVSAAEQNVIQLCITSASEYFLWRTGRGPADQSFPTQSPYVQAVEYNEFYDGNGSPRMFVRNAPIQAVSLLKINTTTVQQSSSYNSPGFVIDYDRKSLSLRNSGAGGTPYTSTYFPTAGSGIGFAKGLQNIQITYTGGYPARAVTDELRAIPGGAGPYTVQTSQAWVSNTSVKYFSDGTPLTRVYVAPAAGEYYIDGNGLYLFNAADKGLELQISYTTPGTPPDISEKITKLVALNYKSRQWMGQSSQAMSNGAGTVTYRDWEMDPDIERCFLGYTRTAMV